MNSIKVQQPFFDQIKNGTKTIEGRIYKDKFASIVSGDVIKIYDASNNNNDYFITAYVKDVRRYMSFYHYLFYEGLERTLPSINNINHGCDMYYQYYTHEQERMYGVVAIELQVIV